jgi:hypothetical protein
MSRTADGGGGSDAGQAPTQSENRTSCCLKLDGIPLIVFDQLFADVQNRVSKKIIVD